MSDPQNYLSPVDYDALSRQLAERDDEIRRLRGIIDSFLSVDIDTGLLNRNGLVESVKRACLWWERRREPFGVMAVRFSDMVGLNPGQANDLASRIAASMSDTGRAVDDTGRIDDRTFVMVLREFQSQGAMTVVSRMRTALREAIADPLVTGELRFGLVVAIEGDSSTPEDYINMAVAAAEQAAPDVPKFAREQ
ncbi:MAG TPA: GGDEF domain-containing protein [Acidimicrobiia bacterium]|nr:GGDEF domain-containing protein [Acidimicrobiia bacterium]